MTIISDVGVDVKVREIERTINKYGDASESPTDHTVKALIVLVDSDDNVVKNGILNVGDAVGFFKPSDKAYIKAGNRVQYQNVWYEIIGEPLVYNIGGTDIHIEANLKRFHQ